MSVLGIVLDVRDSEMYAPVEDTTEDAIPAPPPRKKAHLMERLRQHDSEQFKRTVRLARGETEYERRQLMTLVKVSLPVVEERREEVREESPIPSPVRQPKRVSPPTSPPRAAASETTTEREETCESPEIEMFMSPLKVRTPPEAVEETEAPLVIPASPIADSMEESLSPKRLRARTIQEPEAMSVAPAPLPERPPLAPPQPIPIQAQQPQQPVQAGLQGRRILKAKIRTRRGEEMSSASGSALGHGGMEMGGESFDQPRLSASSFGSAQQSFTDTSTPGSFFGSGTPSSLTYQTAQSSFQASPQNPFGQNITQPPQQPMGNPFQAPSSFTSGTPSPSHFGSFQPSPSPTFPQQQPMHPPPPSNEQPFMPSSDVAFSFGRQSTPVTRRGRSYGRRRSRNN